MSVDRIERLNELLRRQISEAFYKVFADGSLDLAGITVTRVSAARNLRNATVAVSVMGREEDATRALHAIRKKAVDLQRLINQEMTLKYTPKLRFQLDGSLEKGDRVLHLLSQLPDDSDDFAGDETLMEESSSYLDNQGDSNG